MITTTSPLVTLITLAQMYNTYLLHTRGHANCRRWSCWTREWHVTSHWCSVSSDPAMATNFVTKLFSSSPWNNVSIKYILHEKLVYQLIHSVFLYLLSPVASINRTINYYTPLLYIINVLSRDYGWKWPLNNYFYQCNIIYHVMGVTKIRPL
jgi:hypothetical protein